MTYVNPKLEPLFSEFCIDYCKYRRGETCLRILKDASLHECPAGEWWDINDHLNKVAELVEQIQSRLKGAPRI